MKMRLSATVSSLKGEFAGGYRVRARSNSTQAIKPTIAEIQQIKSLSWLRFSVPAGSTPSSVILHPSSLVQMRAKGRYGRFEDDVEDDRQRQGDEEHEGDAHPTD